MNSGLRILLVDDDFDIRDSLSKFLERQNFKVTAVSNAFAARRELQHTSWDLLLLDIMMPGMSGLRLCQQLSKESSPPIIFLSARTSVDDRINGLRAGADDYLCKPFDTYELLERIRAVARRSRRQENQELCNPLINFYRFDRWTLQVARRMLTRDDGVNFVLHSAEFQLLLAFLQRPGIVLSRDRLMSLVGIDGTDVLDRSVDSRISRIRKKIERDPRDSKLITTVRGDGYLFDADVQEG